MAETYLDCGLTHSQTLLPAVDALCRAACVPPQSLDAAAVTRGPGSFTGLRIGMAAAKAVAAALQIPLAGVSTLRALAYNLRGFEGTCCAALDARCNQVYYALFSLHAGEVHRLTDDAADSVQQAAGTILRAKGPVFLVGDGAALCYNEAIRCAADPDPIKTRLHTAPPHLMYQRASSVAFAAAEKGVFLDAAALAPAYLRLSQAERERAAKQAANGR